MFFNLPYTSIPWRSWLVMSALKVYFVLTTGFVKKLTEYLRNHLQTIWKKSQEIKQNYTRPKNVDTCFCVFFEDQCKNFFERFLCFLQGILTLSCLPINFWDFPNVFLFSNILSLKFRGRFSCDLYVKKTDLVIDTTFRFTCGEWNL